MDAYSLRRNNLHLKTKNFNFKKNSTFQYNILIESVFIVNVSVLLK